MEIRNFNKDNDTKLKYLFSLLKDRVKETEVKRRKCNKFSGDKSKNDEKFRKLSKSDAVGEIRAEGADMKALIGALREVCADMPPISKGDWLSSQKETPQT